MPAGLPVLLGVLIAFGCLVMALSFLRRKRLLEDLPTSKAQGVFMGLVELKGTAESETPLTSYLAEVSCVQYAWVVEEHWSRTVTETHTDSKGRTQTRTRTESGWARVGDGGDSAPFYLRDDTGVIRVVPEGARIEAATVFSETVTPASPLYFRKARPNEVASSSHRRRFRETAIPLHAEIFLIGQARERQDAVAPEIVRHKEAPVFLITTRTEKQVTTGLGRWYWFWLSLGLVVAAGSAALWAMLQDLPLPGPWQWHALAVFLFLVAVGLGWVWTVYNSLVNLRQRVRQGWSEVDVQLKQRNDLIPKLVQTVEGFRAHESQVQTLVADLRAQLAATPPGVAGPDFRGLAPELRLVMEGYPELKASNHFLGLQQALTEAEQRIALARDYFNGVAAFYNIRLAIIPDRFVAALAGLRPQPFLRATDFERAEVQVRLTP